MSATRAKRASEVEKIRANCERAVKSARFKDEATYVPYYWSLRNSPTRDVAVWGTVFGFGVTAEDRKIFPELARRDVVAVRETDGLVHETSPEDAAWETMMQKE